MAIRLGALLGEAFEVAPYITPRILNCMVPQEALFALPSRALQLLEFSEESIELRRMGTT